jgi:hypothetical protein
MDAATGTASKAPMAVVAMMRERKKRKASFLEGPTRKSTC